MWECLWLQGTQLLHLQHAVVSPMAHWHLLFQLLFNKQLWLLYVLLIAWSKVWAPACPALQRGCSSVVMHIMSITYPHQHAITYPQHAIHSLISIQRALIGGCLRTSYPEIVIC